MNKKILITGISGFVGANLAMRLIQNGYEVHGFIRSDSEKYWRLRNIAPSIILHEVNILDIGALTDSVINIAPEIIFHLATYGAYAHQNEPKKILETAIFPTLSILQAAKNCGVKMIVNAGSSSEYGEKKLPMIETDLLQPNSYYAVAKASQSLLAQYFSLRENIPVVTLRLFSVYGPYEEPGRYIPTVIRNVLLNKDVLIADFRIARDFVYIDDVIDVFIFVSTQPQLAGKIINIGTGIQSTLLDIFKEAVELTGSLSSPIEGVYKKREFDTDTWVADTQLVQKVLKTYKPRSLRDGLIKMIEWFKMSQCYY